MKKLIYFILFIPFGLFAQTAEPTPQPGELFQLRMLTDDQLNELKDSGGLSEGTMVYNSDEKALFVFNGDDWDQAQSPSFSGSVVISGNGNETIDNLPFKPSRVEFTAYANIDDFGLNEVNELDDTNGPLAFAAMNGFAQSDGNSITQGVISSGKSTPSENVTITVNTIGFIGSGQAPSPVNLISTYSNENQCIGIQYIQEDGSIQVTSAALSSFTSDGFVLSVNAPNDLLVFFTAYQ